MRGSLLWILLLLAALFAGPAVILHRASASPDGVASLRRAAQRERLLDAPSDAALNPRAAQPPPAGSAGAAPRRP